MGASNQPRRGYRSAWAVFAFFVALPSVVLAFAGLRTFSAAEIERADALRRRADFIARDANDSLQAAIGNASGLSRSAPMPPGVTLFRRDADGALSFPQHRVFVANVGIIPAALSIDDSAAVHAGEIPAAVVTAIVSRSPAAERHALGQLRAGAWWLHLDQRRAYDTELAGKLAAGGASDIAPTDPQLQRLAQVQLLLAGSATGAAGSVSATRATDGTWLVAWSREDRSDGSSAGVVFNPAETKTLIDAALHDSAADNAMAVDIRDSTGLEVWRRGERRVPEDTGSRPLSAVAGWSLRVSLIESAQSGRSWSAYGLVVLPIVVLAFGLVMTSVVVRREVALARRQAEFTAAVTHEFKSPITSLRLLMERISSGRVTGGPALAEYHDAITRETDRLDTLVNRLLDAQQIQAGRRRHDPAMTLVASIVEGSIERLRAQASAKQIELRVDQPLPSLELLLDGNTVSDALDNLIDNAIKYSKAGTLVTISARVADGTLDLAVRDQGAGIHRSDLPHVFEPYYRGRLGDRENVRGTGLGLALVQAAATTHGGHVSVVSEPEHGSTFTLRLPLGPSS